jgi:hypothetical protein
MSVTYTDGHFDNSSQREAMHDARHRPYATITGISSRQFVVPITRMTRSIWPLGAHYEVMSRSL